MKPIIPYVNMLRRFAGGALALNIAGMTLASLFEGAGIFLVIPLLGASGFLETAPDAVPLFGPLLARLREASPADSLLPVLLGLFVLIVVCQNVLQRFVAIRNTMIVHRFGRSIRLELFDALHDAGWSFFLRKRRTDLINAMTTETARMLHGVGLMLQAAAAFIFTVLQAAIAFVMSPALTTLVLVCGGIVLLLSRRLVGKARTLGKLTSELSQEYLSGVHDQLEGMKDIKSNDMAAGGRRWIRGITERLVQEQYAYIRLRSATDAGYRIASAVLVAMFLYAAVRLLHTPPHILLLIIVIFARLWPRISMLQMQLQQLAAAAPAFGAVTALLEECRRERDMAVLPAAAAVAAGEAEDDGEDKGVRPHGESVAGAGDVCSAASSAVVSVLAGSDAGKSGVSSAASSSRTASARGMSLSEPSLRLERGIRLSGVSFSYEGTGGRKALDRINLYIPAFATTAIVGHSGAGKSTLVDTVMGLIRPQEGTIRIDGNPLTGELLASMRRSVGYVPQDPFLFNGTIADNLRMANPEASEADMLEALRFAAADEFVGRLPRGLHTSIGDRGVRLSGGERQRIVLARAMLRNPRILILDEATSALDSESEAAIRDSLDRLQGRMTIIVIAHRLSTIRGADQVVVMEQGRIVQCGGYDTLAADRSGLFDRLLRHQTVNA